MIRQSFAVSVGLVLTIVCLAAQFRQNDSKDGVRARIVGTWALVSTEEHMADGSKRPYLDVGAHGKGYLIYTADGHMCAAGMNPDRPAWLDVNHPTREESFVRWRVSLAMALRNRRNQSRDLSLPQRLPWIQTA